MKTEKIINKTSSRCLNITASKVDSLRINNDLENTVRVYNNGAIGVEGALGNVDFQQLEQSAKAKLAQGIPYPETHDKAIKRSVDATKQILSDKEFIPAIDSRRKIPIFCSATKYCLTAWKELTKTRTEPYSNTKATNSTADWR